MVTVSELNPVDDKKARLKHLIKNLPNLPGVYKMLGKNGDILYVGKAKSLKSRVNSYFAKTIDHPKTRALVARIHNIETIITRSETEALLLEQNLIKEYRPPYNVLLRDDKSYLYVFISADKPYPRLAYGRGKGNHQKGRFFGPFPSAHAAKETLVLMQKMFQMRQCTNTFFKQRQRPCLEYQIKRCRAPCVGLVSPEEYAEDVNNTIRFLKGDSSDIHSTLIEKMEGAAETLDFEKAVLYRDQLSMLREVQARQAVYTVQGEADVIAIASQAGMTCVNVLTVRGGRVLGGKNYFPDVDSSEPLADNLSDFITSFYFQVTDDLPAEIILSHEIPDQVAVSEALATHFGSKVVIKTNVREHRSEWLDLATLNTSNALKTKLGDYLELHARFGALKDVLAEVTDRTIDRIECFDISHTMGEATIGSCVVFDQGGARRRDYRQYAIHDIQGGDDYAAMKQVLTRRYKKQPLPDLLLIDGGKGQLSMAKEVLVELGILGDTLLIGVAKGEGRKAGLEVLHFLDHEPLDLPMDSKALHLLMHIRDEAHRFAITAHRKKRDKRRSSSVLEVIPGLGEKRRRDLLNHFGGMQQLLGASQQELAGVQGIGPVLAKTVYKVLHE
ncbi:excinuclease ABC subunit UvrC [Psychrobacter pacificensis]|uniref:UvrABC system protein C n=1 Tax=Psychrobacter pacificensis TaxID=112002 RepID=A0A1G6Y7L2_9GAMM|nr:excinuclease ABC subunit UvrC [Psychrobacter pacificensis]MED6316947.1 excinuclease ABC subunit UvrC [Pseudomonadota bacterium]GLR29620.1 UvrABC system protein C [Psychrobacter pacificensis]SDD85707.1 Excinuclease ABC subunit C [Psychrobacter pacificensis]